MKPHISIMAEIFGYFTKPFDLQSPFNHLVPKRLTELFLHWCSFELGKKSYGNLFKAFGRHLGEKGKRSKRSKMQKPKKREKIRLLDTTWYVNTQKWLFTKVCLFDRGRQSMPTNNLAPSVAWRPGDAPNIVSTVVHPIQDHELPIRGRKLRCRP